MKVMYLLFSFTVGGTERLVVDICNEMVKRGNEIIVYIINCLYDESLLKTLDSKVTVVCKDRPVGSKTKAMEILELCMFCKRHGIDVIHSNSFNMSEMLAFVKLFCKNTKIVQTIHDVGQYSSLNKARVAYRNWLNDVTIAISESVKKDIVQAGANACKIVVVYNAIDLTKYVSHRKYPRRMNSDKIVIGNVARIDCSKKGQDILIQAVSILKNDYDIECIFAGGADKAHEKELVKLECMARDAVRGSDSRIRFLGNVNDIPDFLDQIDIFVLPSRYEGFGVSLIEAMNMKIPCIASGLDGPGEIIGNEERGLLFRPGDSKDLAEKLRQIINHYELYADKAVYSGKYVEEHFDICKMVEKLEKVYRGVSSLAET